MDCASRGYRQAARWLSARSGARGQVSTGTDHAGAVPSARPLIDGPAMGDSRRAAAGLTTADQVANRQQGIGSDFFVPKLSLSEQHIWAIDMFSCSINAE